MNKIEELKNKLTERAVNGCNNESIRLPMVLEAIDEAVSIADLQNAEKIAELERLHEKEIKEAVERERARYIEKIIDSPLTSDFIEYINDKYFPPQQEYCEWDAKGYGRYKHCRGQNVYSDVYVSMDFKFCPYCGKPIKVKEV